MNHFAPFIICFCERDNIKGEKMTNQNRRHLEWAISFWIGVGLMSIINVWKITQNQHAISYSWIMFGISIIFIIICAILIKVKK
jgi:hypothetical protein